MSISAISEAQESIFVPMPNAEAEHEMVQNGDALSEWIRLQADLYKIVLTFDEKAKQLERNLLHNEQARLNNEEIRFRGQTEHRSPDANGNYGGEMQVYGSTMCSELNDSLERYITKNIPALDVAIKKLVAQTDNLNESDKEAFAKRVRVALAAVPNLRRSQEILYLCLYKYKTESGTPAPWSVEKTLRKWYAVQVPILDSWLGNVD